MGGEVKDLLAERLRRLIEPVAEELGLDLVDLEWRRKGAGGVLRVFVDRRGGISLGECERLSKRLDPLLDAEDLLEGRYHLEVSSPGLDRPLRRVADFERAVGERVRFRLEPSEDRPGELVGRLCGAGATLRVELDDGRTIDLRLNEVRDARREVEF
jgi:ribosome maturation factor RimP